MAKGAAVLLNSYPVNVENMRQVFLLKENLVWLSLRHSGSAEPISLNWHALDLPDLQLSLEVRVQALILRITILVLKYPAHDSFYN